MEEKLNSLLIELRHEMELKDSFEEESLRQIVLEQIDKCIGSQLDSDIQDLAHLLDEISQFEMGKAKIKYDAAKIFTNTTNQIASLLDRQAEELSQIPI